MVDKLSYTFAHGAMDRRIDSSWSTHLAISRSSQCSTTDVTKTGICYFCLWDGVFKRALAPNQKE